MSLHATETGTSIERPDKWLERNDFKAYDPSEWKRRESLARAQRVAQWTNTKMQDPEGYLYLWKNSWFTNRTPTFHWGATTMQHALAHLLRERTSREY
jgi:hypothetical protein